jgi:hypothetical protein
VIPIDLNRAHDFNGLAFIEWPWGMPKHICKALDDWIFGRPCTATAMKTKRGAWRCPLHGGLSTGPKTAEGKARISAAARARWAAYREAKGAIANNVGSMAETSTG